MTVQTEEVHSELRNISLHDISKINERLSDLPSQSSLESISTDVDTIKDDVKFIVENTTWGLSGSEILTDISSMESEIRAISNHVETIAAEVSMSD